MLEFYAELERRIGRGEELAFVDPQRRKVQMDLRDRRFADADRADGIRFDQ